MLRFSRHQLATRTAGYVFWRQRTLIELEKSKRSYLLNERPYPVAEIARRMVRVRSRYAATSDFHEQTLLRGEYKYFSGKLLDLRRAQLSDLIAYVEMGSVFGFWDSAQIDRVLDELVLHLSELDGNQLIHLLSATSGVRKHQSHLYKTVAEALVPQVPNMAFEDVVRLVKACEVEDPPPLLEALFARIAADLGSVTVHAAVATLSAMTCAAKAAQEHYEVMIQELKAMLVDELQQQQHGVGSGSEGNVAYAGGGDASPGADHDDALSLLDVATVAEALASLETLDLTTRECLMRSFLLRLHEACPRSLAMMFYACDSIDLARAAERRVLHHMMRFSTAELYAVTKVYLKALGDMSNVAPPTLRRTTGGNDEGCKAASSPPVTLTVNRGTSLLEDLNESMPLLLTTEERNAAEAKRRDLARVVQELMQQLLDHVESPTAHAQPEIYLGLLRCCAECKAHTDLLGPTMRSTVHAVCSRTVSMAREMSVDQLMEFLVLSNLLGVMALHAAVISIMDMLRSRIVSSAAAAMGATSSGGVVGQFAVGSGDAAVLYNTLHELTGLNALQRRKLEGDILPLLRQRVGEDDVASLRF
jgi:hypothetical protein